MAEKHDQQTQAMAKVDMSVELIRLASDPQFNPATLQALIDMHERAETKAAKEAFNAAFSAMQADLPVIDKRGAITVKGEQRSKYSRWQDIQRVILPILHRHGFSLSFRNTFPEAKTIEVTAILRHAQGHEAENSFRAKADDTGSKNDIQAIGSSQSYAQRYATIGLLNIQCDDKTMRDDDGEGSDKPEAPKGYDVFMDDLAASADEGPDAFSTAWKDATKKSKALTDYALKHDRKRLEGFKVIAQQAKPKETE